MQRLSKILASCGVASRRACEKIIFEKRVKVNGIIITTPQTFVNIEKDTILLDNKKIHQKEKKVYYLLNKPRGWICTNSNHIKKKVIDLFPKTFRLFTVGRLDKETSGLLIVTNDGHFANQVIHPSFDLEKEYQVHVSQEITHKHLTIISKGALVEKKWQKPQNVQKSSKKILHIIVKEGKKHEVRIFVKKADLNILALKRIRIGPLKLSSLKEGEYRLLTKKEMAAFYKKDS